MSQHYAFGQYIGNDKQPIGRHRLDLYRTANRYLILVFSEFYGRNLLLILLKLPDTRPISFSMNSTSCRGDKSIKTTTP